MRKSIMYLTAVIAVMFLLIACAGPDGTPPVGNPPVGTTPPVEPPTPIKFKLDLGKVGPGNVVGNGEYENGATATVSATPMDGSALMGWSGPNGVECAAGSVTMTAAKSCTATFAAAAIPPVVEPVKKFVLPKGAYVEQIVADATGVYVSGTTDRNKSLKAEENSFGERDVFILKFSLDGLKLLWLKQLGGPNDDLAPKLAIFGSEVYFSWTEMGVLPVAGGTTPAKSYVRSYDSSGNPLWVMQLPGDETYNSAFAVDAVNLYELSDYSIKVINKNGSIRNSFLVGGVNGYNFEISAIVPHGEFIYATGRSFGVDLNENLVVARYRISDGETRFSEYVTGGADGGRDLVVLDNVISVSGHTEVNGNNVTCLLRFDLDGNLMPLLPNPLIVSSGQMVADQEGSVYIASSGKTTKVRDNTIAWSVDHYYSEAVAVAGEVVYTEWRFPRKSIDDDEVVVIQRRDAKNGVTLD